MSYFVKCEQCGKIILSYDSTVCEQCLEKIKKEQEKGI